MKILLVDDNSELRQAGRELLEALGHRVVEAEDGASALAAARRSGRGFDVVVTDFSMPGIDGVELAARLRREGRARGVLLVSSEAADPELGRRARDLGAALLGKPFTSAELEAGLGEALSRSAGSAGTGARAAAPRYRPLLAWGLPAAVVAAVAAGLAILALDPGPPTLPAPPADDVVRGAEVRGLEPTGPIAALPPALSWQPVEDAAGYRVTLYEVDDAVLWSGASERERLELPAEVSGAILPAVAYTWTVEAVDATGRRLAWSQPTRFRVLPPREGARESGDEEAGR